LNQPVCDKSSACGTGEGGISRGKELSVVVFAVAFKLFLFLNQFPGDLDFSFSFSILSVSAWGIDIEGVFTELEKILGGKGGKGGGGSDVELSIVVEKEGVEVEGRGDLSVVCRCPSCVCPSELLAPASVPPRLADTEGGLRRELKSLLPKLTGEPATGAGFEGCGVLSEGRTGGMETAGKTGSPELGCWDMGGSTGI